MSKSAGLMFEKFEILDTLKKDSHSAVYLAMHTLLGKEIILKTLNTKSIPDETIVERFKREGKLLARLDHPNIIKILDFGTYQDTLYISFEYFKGITLRDAMQQGDLNEEQKRSIFVQLLSGLEAAHKEKIIHRDLKPENILLDSRNIVKIADFGLASSELETTVTNKSSILGTPGYMSPEQIYGEKLTIQSDIFSVGVIGYELFTGNNPFLKADISQTVNSILSFNDADIVFPSELSEEIKNAISRCIKKSKKERVQTVTEVIPLFGVVNIAPVLVAESVAVKRGFSPGMVTAVAAVFIAVLLAVVYLRPHPEDEKNRTNLQSDTLNGKQTQTETSPAGTRGNVAGNPVQENKQEKTNPVKGTEEQKVKDEKKEPEIKTGPALVSVTCSPWAMVYFDNEKIDMTPLRTPVNTISGSHTIRLEHPDFPPYTAQITLVPGELKNIQVNLEDEFSSLDMKVLPWGTVFLNGTSYGETPFKKPLRLKPGKYTLKITNPSFQDYTETFTVKKGEKFSRSINLQPKVN